MNFILFFSMPVFYNVMNEAYFKHLILLVISLERLLAKNIELNNLDLVHSNLSEFVENLSSLYDDHIMTSASHEILHLVKSTRELGPLNQVNCYPFEELNRKITRLIKSQDLVGDEFIKLWSVSRNLGLYINELEYSDNKFIKFVKENFGLKSSNLKKKNKEKILIKLGKYSEQKNLSDRIRYFIKNIVSYDDDICLYERLYFNNIVYSSELNKETKYSDSTIIFKDQVGIISNIVKSNDLIFIICRKLNLFESQFFYIESNAYNSSYRVYTISRSYFYVKHSEFKDLKKLFSIPYEENLVFVNHFTSNHLFS